MVVLVHSNPADYLNPRTTIPIAVLGVVWGAAPRTTLKTTMGVVVLVHSSPAEHLNPETTISYILIENQSFLLILIEKHIVSIDLD